MIKENNFTATRNPCKTCSPLGASIVFRGIKNSIPFIHGGQGCATYIRRYLISHFKEPVDIASSNFSESTTIFGGEENLIAGLENIIKQYNPDFIGIATSCLAETIGEDLTIILSKFYKKHEGEKIPEIVNVSTPSYNGTHMNGFYKSVAKVIEKISEPGKNANQINIFPSFVSPADLRHIKEITDDFGLESIIFPDYSDTLDAPAWEEYKKISEGGIEISELKKTGGSAASITLGNCMNDNESAGIYLEKKFGVQYFPIALPIGIIQTDLFFRILSEISGITIPDKYKKERGRLLDSYADGHKYLFGKKAIVYGEEDLVVSIANFLLEVGIIPVLCASGGNSGKMKNGIKTGDFKDQIIIKSSVDFEEISNEAKEVFPDIIIGNSKGNRIARELNVPLVRLGFPIHDRIGGQRILQLGYRGTQNLFDWITNALIEDKQNKSTVGYSYI